MRLCRHARHHCACRRYPRCAAGDSAGHRCKRRARFAWRDRHSRALLPDNVPRSLDGLEAARFAKDRGMRAIVLKSHFDPTAGLAFLARKAVQGIEVFGGIDLNLPVGGMNPHAVEHMARVNGGWGRMVWMSTFDSENQMRVNKSKAPFVQRLGERRAAARDEGGDCRHREAQPRARERSRVRPGSAVDVRGRAPRRRPRHGGDARHVGADVSHRRAGTAGGGARRLHRVLKRHAGDGERAGQGRSTRRRHPPGGRRARHSLVGSRAGRQSTAG